MEKQNYIYFTIPGMWERWPLVITLLILYKQHPEYFYNNIKIDSVYGNFSPCIWDGGRPQISDPYMIKTTIEDIYNIQKIYNNIFKISIRFVFTNSLIQKEHLKNIFCNNILNIFNTGENEIVINSLLLEEYIRQNYQNYSFISSITKTLNKEQFIQELSNNNYKLVCMASKYNKDKNFLQQIPIQLQTKIELLVNTYCLSSCPNKKLHYYLMSKSNLYQKKIPTNQIKCPIYITQRTNENDANLNYQNINNYQKNYNINHFKINGRLLEPYDIWINNIFNYLILSYYKKQALLKFQNIYNTIILQNNSNLNIIKNKLKENYNFYG